LSRFEFLPNIVFPSEISGAVCTPCGCRERATRMMYWRLGRKLLACALHGGPRELQSGQDENLIKRIFYTFDMCVRKTRRVCSGVVARAAQYRRGGERGGEAKKNTKTQRNSSSSVSASGDT